MKGSLDDLKINKTKFEMIILDMMNVIKRYYFKMKNLSDSKGRSTGILYGVLNFVCSLKEKYKSVNIIAAWDCRAERKKEIDKNYKANRVHEEKNDFWDQVRELKILLALFNVNQYYADGYEADDIAAKVVKENKGKVILLVSKDNDWNQLLCETVFVMRDNEILTREDVQKEYEFEIGKHLLVKSIIGESGDNIITSIKNFPRKILYKIVKKSETVEDIFSLCQKHQDNKWCKLILEKKETVLRNYKLARMIDEGYDIQEIEKINDRKKLLVKIKDYEMNKLYERIKNEK